MDEKQIYELAEELAYDIVEHDYDEVAEPDKLTEIIARKLRQLFKNQIT